MMYKRRLAINVQRLTAEVQYDTWYACVKNLVCYCKSMFILFLPFLLIYYYCLHYITVFLEGTSPKD